jgi:predicted transcriptional regulator of viral defense system
MRFELLERPEFGAFTTREFAVEADIAMATATRQLSRAAARGAVVRLTRGVWANPGNSAFHPLACVPKILGREQGYVSFLTALHLHGVLSQIPRTIQVATTGHGRRLITPVATYELFRLSPALMRAGIEWSDTRAPYRIATVEKALLDTLYIGLRRGRRFRKLPELELHGLSRRRCRALLSQASDPRVATAVERRFRELVGEPPRD